MRKKCKKVKVFLIVCIIEQMVHLNNFIITKSYSFQLTLNIFDVCLSDFKNHKHFKLKKIFCKCRKKILEKVNFHPGNP